MPRKSKKATHRIFEIRGVALLLGSNWPWTFARPSSWRVGRREGGSWVWMRAWNARGIQGDTSWYMVIDGCDYSYIMLYIYTWLYYVMMLYHIMWCQLLVSKSIFCSSSLMNKNISAWVAQRCRGAYRNIEIKELHRDLLRICLIFRYSVFWSYGQLWPAMAHISPCLSCLLNTNPPRSSHVSIFRAMCAAARHDWRPGV
jgi:hypothetical protein